MIKVVYVMLESRSDNWSYVGDTDWFENYSNKIIGVYASYDDAKNCMNKWREAMMKCDGAKYEINERSLECEVVFEPEETPYGFEYMKNHTYEVRYRRYLSPQFLIERDS